MLIFILFSIHALLLCGIVSQGSGVIGTKQYFIHYATSFCDRLTGGFGDALYQARFAMLVLIAKTIWV